MQIVADNLTYFARWPQEMHTFLPGSIRTKREHHKYDAALKAEYRAKVGSGLDSRPNGPAIAAFLFAGGERPNRVGTHAWSIHHIYNGKFPYLGRSATLHAVKDGNHFTNSAGLIAAHPILDTMVDEYAVLAWRLRAEAFLRFGYDPDGVFLPA